LSDAFSVDIDIESISSIHHRRYRKPFQSGFSTDMYGALLEDMKLAMEKNKANASVISDLQASLAACEHKLSLAMSRNYNEKRRSVQSVEEDAGEAEDGDKPVSSGAGWRYRVVRVRTAALHSRALRRYLLAKVEAFSLAR
jgi:hypothetical protein